MEKIPKRNPEARRQELHEINDRDMHFSNLHDEDADQSGETVDLATGKKYDNSTETGLEGLNKVDESELVTDEIVEDAAEKWLKENDPDYGKEDDSLAA